MALLRIDKILSSQNISTRSETKALIKKGLVTVNGNTVKRPEEKFDPETAVITVGGKTVSFKKFLYLMMNKPSGVLSASRDKHTPTVIDLLPAEIKREGLFHFWKVKC